jgi:hypothetical protein
MPLFQLNELTRLKSGRKSFTLVKVEVELKVELEQEA